MTTRTAWGHGLATIAADGTVTIASDKAVTVHVYAGEMTHCTIFVPASTRRRSTARSRTMRA